MFRKLKQARREKRKNKLYIANPTLQSEGSCRFIPNLFSPREINRLVADHKRILIYGQKEFTEKAAKWAQVEGKEITVFNEPTQLYYRTVQWPFDLVILLTTKEHFFVFLRSVIHGRNYRGELAIPATQEGSCSLERIESKMPIYLLCFACCGANRLMFGFRHLMRTIDWEQKPHLTTSHNVKLTDNFKNWNEFAEAQRWYNYHLDYCQWTSTNDWIHPKHVEIEGCRSVVLCRDPRDVVNSFFWHTWADYGYDPNHLLNIIRGLFHSTRIDFTNQWPSAKEKCEMMLYAQESLNCTVIRFEDMHKSDEGALKKLMTELGLYPHPFGMQEQDFVHAALLGSFDHQIGDRRKRGEGTSSKELRFISACRKGVVGDWRSSFTKEACDLFKEQTGDALIKLGYETSMDWEANAKVH